jgi:hypothetical protein
MKAKIVGALALISLALFGCGGGGGGGDNPPSDPFDRNVYCDRDCIIAFARNMNHVELFDTVLFSYFNFTAIESTSISIFHPVNEAAANVFQAKLNTLLEYEANYQGCYIGESYDYHGDLAELWEDISIGEYDQYTGVLCADIKGGDLILSSKSSHLGAWLGGLNIRSQRRQIEIMSLED